MTYLLALDQGTSSSRSIVFDAHGAIVAMAQRELPQIYPQPGWVEHDALRIWDDQLATAREALSRAGITARDIAALGITNQRETAVVWNRKTGQPIHHAIVWQDRRGEPLCAQLREQGHAQRIQARTGLLIDSYFSATKVRWLLDNVPGARAQAERGELAFGTIDSWLLWQLTDGALHATDVTNASRTMLFDVHRNRWDEELLGLLRHPGIADAAGAAFERGLRPQRRAPAGRAGAHRRRRRRPAERAVRPGLLPRRHGQEHLRHRLLPADAHGRPLPAVGQRPADHQRGPDHSDAAVRDGGQRVRGRRGGAVAARRAGRDQEQRRDRGARRQRARCGRRDAGAGLHRPRCAVLEAGCARRDHRPHARDPPSPMSRARRSRASPTRARRCCRP